MTFLTSWLAHWLHIYNCILGFIYVFVYFVCFFVVFDNRVMPLQNSCSITFMVVLPFAMSFFFASESLLSHLFQEMAHFFTPVLCLHVLLCTCNCTGSVFLTLTNAFPLESQFPQSLQRSNILQTAKAICHNNFALTWPLAIPQTNLIPNYSIW